MAKNEERVMQFVEAELERSPDIATSDLFEKAKKVDSGWGSSPFASSTRDSHSRSKRRKSLASPRKGRKTKSRGAPAARGTGRRAGQDRRDAMREVFLRFASDLASAEERKDVVRVLAGVEAYVADALKAAGR